MSAEGSAAGVAVRLMVGVGAATVAAVAAAGTWMAVLGGQCSSSSSCAYGDPGALPLTVVALAFAVMAFAVGRLAQWLLGGANRRVAHRLAWIGAGSLLVGVGLMVAATDRVSVALAAREAQDNTGWAGFGDISAGMTSSFMELGCVVFTVSALAGIAALAGAARRMISAPAGAR